jgi:catechol 2,3-dioxygenase-like lactoylglutathione lyase family enzyme
MTVKHLDHVNLSVGNLEETGDWYGRVFGFRWVERGLYRGRPWGVLRSGDALLCVYEHPDCEFEDSEARAGRAIHGMAHFGLRVTDKAAWVATLRRERVEVHHTWRYPHSDSWYINDPTGYEIEVACWDNDQVSFDHAEAGAASSVSA